ncbi:GAF domain-containing SpoIIE family protein phosphatase [Streptomyces vinaceus]|uniref:GAF domain-containing SpoIIE family protein phosphatase n=1 Tax=Streptomyces vinaceus TaxID=1960 RepID=UPI0036832798
MPLANPSPVLPSARLVPHRAAAGAGALFPGAPVGYTGIRWETIHGPQGGALNRFARLATRLLSAPQGLVWLNPPGGSASAAPECWPTGISVPPGVIRCCLRVAELGQPLFLPVGGSDPEFSFAGVPLAGGSGQLLGVLAVVDDRPRPWTADEVRDLSDLAAACSAQIRARMRAESGRRAQEEAEEAVDVAQAAAAGLRSLLGRSQLLLRAAEDLADTSGLDEVRHRVGDLVSGDLKPSYIGMALVQHGWLRRIADPVGGDQPIEQVPEAYALSSRWPSARAARENRMIVIGDRSEITAAYAPEAVAGFDSLGLSTAVCLPLRGTRAVLGTLVLGWESPYDIDTAERAVLTTLAGYAAQAVERALHLDERITVARQLQQAMLTELPAVAGLELAALYRPAARDDLVGGDWYDAYPLPSASGAEPGGALAVTVGDITGHDMQAAAVMGQIRSMLRQADHDFPGRGPDQSMTAVERAWLRLGIEASCTMIHAHLTPDLDGSWHLKWSNAGHPPPLLADPDGTVEHLVRHDVLLHPALPCKPRTCDTRTVKPGSILLLYTDGLVERRGRDIGARIELLGQQLATLSPHVPLEPALRQLLHVVGPAEPDDDTVLLGLRVPAL